MKAKKLTISAFVLFLTFCVMCVITLSSIKIQAQDTIPQKAESSLTIERATLATSIIDREPEGTGETFPRDIEKIYFFTQVIGAVNPTVIYHRWYYAGQLMAEVELPVNSINWRTYSSKRIMYQWIGNWTVEAVDAEGNVLKTLSFEVN